MDLFSIIRKMFGRRKARKNKSHLEYDSLTSWAAGIGLPKDWTRHPDQVQRDLWWRQYAELKQHLWRRHVSTLTPEEQQQFKDGTHPSLHHESAERARAFCALLEDALKNQGIPSVVKVGFYHMDRIVLTAHLSELPPAGLPGEPWLFRGFEVKAVLATKPLEEYR